MSSLLNLVIAKSNLAIMTIILAILMNQLNQAMTKLNLETQNSLEITTMNRVMTNKQKMMIINLAKANTKILVNRVTMSNQAIQEMRHLLSLDKMKLILVLRRSQVRQVMRLTLPYLAMKITTMEMMKTQAVAKSLLSLVIAKNNRAILNNLLNRATKIITLKILWILVTMISLVNQVMTRNNHQNQAMIKLNLETQRTLVRTIIILVILMNLISLVTKNNLETIAASLATMSNLRNQEITTIILAIPNNQTSLARIAKMIRMETTIQPNHQNQHHLNQVM